MGKKAEEVTTKVISIERLVVHSRNYNRHPPEHILDLRKAIREFGYVRRIVTQEPAKADGRYTVVAGNGIFEALVLEGYKEIECTVIPASWPPQKVSAYLVADNEQHRRSQSDDVQLLSLLKEVREYDKELLAATSYTDAEYHQLLAEIAGEVAPEEVAVKAIDLTEPPKMAWVLVGVPLVQFGGISNLVDQLAAVPDIILETTVSN